MKLSIIVSMLFLTSCINDNEDLIKHGIEDFRGYHISNDTLYFWGRGDGKDIHIPIDIVTANTVCKGVKVEKGISMRCDGGVNYLFSKATFFHTGSVQIISTFKK